MTRSRLRWLAILLAILCTAVVVVLSTDLFLSELSVGPLGTERGAEQWAEQVSRVHGTRAAWLAQGEVELTTRGELEFPPVRAMFGTSLTESTVELTFAFRPDTHGLYRYTLRQGDEVRSGETDTRSDRDAVGFMLDSVRHLFEVAWLVPTVPFRRGIETKAEGRDGVFLTWGTDEAPSAKYDQVALWSRDGQITRMETTGRDVAPFTVARVDFEGAVRLDELRFPREATVRDPIGIVIERWELLRVARVR